MPSAGSVSWRPVSGNTSSITCHFMSSFDTGIRLYWVMTEAHVRTTAQSHSMEWNNQQLTCKSDILTITSTHTYTHKCTCRWHVMTSIECKDTVYYFTNPPYVNGNIHTCLTRVCHHCVSTRLHLSASSWDSSATWCGTVSLSVCRRAQRPVTTRVRWWHSHLVTSAA